MAEFCKPCAIFDMDGTLLDSMGMWDKVTERVLGRYGKRFDEADRVRTAPLTVLGTAEFFVREYGVPAAPEELARQVREEAGAFYTGEVQLKPGAAAVLDALRARGVRLCVASGTEKPLVDAALKHLGILDRFAFTAACLDDQGKDGPEVYLRCARLLGAAPRDIMVFEDSPVAFFTAKRAGFAVTAVRDHSNDGCWEELCATADGVCENWTDWLRARGFGG